MDDKKSSGPEVSSSVSSGCSAWQSLANLDKTFSPETPRSLFSAQAGRPNQSGGETSGKLSTQLLKAFQIIFDLQK